MLNRSNIAVVAVAAVGVTLSTLAWWALRRIEERALRQTTETAAVAAEHSLEIALDARLRSMRRMASRWEADGGTTRAQWQMDAEAYVRDFPGLESLLWVDATGRTRWIAGRESAPSTEEEPLRGFLVEAARGHDLHIRAAVELGLGPAFVVAIPLFPDDRLDGYLLGIFLFSNTFEAILHNTLNRGLHLRVGTDGSTFYESTREALPAWAPKRTVRIADRSWHVTMAPGPAVEAEARTMAPGLALLSGLLLTGLAVVWMRSRSPLPASDAALLAASPHSPQKTTVSIRTKLALFVSLIVALIGGAIGSLVYFTVADRLIEDQLRFLRNDARSLASTFANRLRTLESEARLLRGVPPIAGLRPAEARGTDPASGPTEGRWRKRLAEIFAQMMQVQPNYRRIIFARADAGGYELVRVERAADGNPVLVSREALHADDPLFRRALDAPAHVVLSSAMLDRRQGRIVEPPRPIVRAATAVAGTPQPFGVIMIDKELTALFWHLREQLPPSHELYVTDAAGEVVLHPSPTRTFRFEHGDSYRLEHELPGLSPAEIARGTAVRTTVDGIRLGIGFHSLRLGDADSSPAFHFAVASRYTQAAAAAIAARDRSIIVTLALLGIASLTGAFWAGSITRPLQQIAAIARKFAATGEPAPLPIASRDEIGHLAQSVGDMMRQVTERREALEREVVHRQEAEKAARENEWRYRNIFDVAPVSIWVEDWTEVITAIHRLPDRDPKDLARYFAEHPDFVSEMLRAVKILDVNRETLTMFHAADKQQMLASLETVFATEDTIPGFVGELNALARGEHVYETEMNLRDVRGELVTVILRMVFPEPEDTSGIVLVSLMNISERKRTEEIVEAQAIEVARQARLLESILLSIGHGVMVANAEGRITHWNPAAEQILGGDVRGDAPPEEWPAFYGTFHVDQVTPFAHDELPLVRAFRGEATDGVEMFVRNPRLPDGAWLNVQGRPIRDERREVQGGLVVFQDITERKHAEAALREYAEELARSNAALDDFAYIASHDLKEPLRGIHNFSHFLIEDYGSKLDDDGRRKLETLGKLSGRMEALIDALLYYSRVGRRDLAVEESDLNVLVEELLESMRPWLEDQNASVQVSGPLPSIHCDRVHVGEVLRNLVVNGVKYNDSEHKEVQIGVLEPKAPGEPVTLYVRDNGIGIPDKHRDKIFSIFTRLHGRDRYGGGTGAGLTIAKKIVERHGGRIWLESEPGAGTTFYFTLQDGHD